MVAWLQTHHCPSQTKQFLVLQQWETHCHKTHPAIERELQTQTQIRWSMVARNPYTNHKPTWWLQTHTHTKPSLAHKLLFVVPTPFSFSVVQPSLSSTSSKQRKREKWKSKIAGITDLRVYKPRSVKRKKKKKQIWERERTGGEREPTKNKTKNTDLWFFNFSTWVYRWFVGGGYIVSGSRI